MNLPRPKSILGLVLIGFVVVALPLLVAVIRGVLYVDQLASQSERLVLQGVQVTRESTSVNEQVTAMERNARQYRVLDDEALMTLYEEKQSRFVSTLDALKRLMRDDTVASRLEQMRDISEGIVPTLRRNPPQSAEVAAALEQFAVLNSLANGIAEQSYRLLDRELESLQETASNARRILIWQSTVLIIGTLALGLLFTVLIARPVRQMGHAIRWLGEGVFDRPIHIGGPPELEALGQQLDWLRRRLAELEQQKNKFLSHMSHELKTPLASIREGTELLMDGTAGELSQTQREVSGILKASGLELQRLIEHLLDVSAWQQKKASLTISHFALRPLIDDIVQQHRLTVLGKQLSVDLSVEDIDLHADEERIRSALDNLISNAVKFSPLNGTIYISVVRHRGEVVIEVADAGPGIPDYERQRIFEPFFQGEAPQRGHVRGTGIGLSVVRECIYAHHGTIEIVDGTYSGAHFRVRLPEEATASEAA